MSQNLTVPILHTFLGIKPEPPNSSGMSTLVTIFVENSIKHGG
jgi:hypothetical protein